MTKQTIFDVLIIGGSYAGLSAGMTLGRALRKVLIIDNGNPCNKQTPHSHNFITQDGKHPLEILQTAKQQVLKYDTVKFYQGLAVKAKVITDGFEIVTNDGSVFIVKKLLFATGLKDFMPSIEGFAACWGISFLHCPYCHGYEVRHQPTGILANGDKAMHYAQLLSNWTNDLTIITNGASQLTADQTAKIHSKNIPIIEQEIEAVEHIDGNVQQIKFKDGSTIAVNVVYTSPPTEQKCSLVEALGCELTETGWVKVNDFRETTVEGVYACGDNSSMRAVAIAVATGGMAGACINLKLSEEAF